MWVNRTNTLYKKKIKVGLKASVTIFSGRKLRRSVPASIANFVEPHLINSRRSTTSEISHTYPDPPGMDIQTAFHLNAGDFP